MNVEELVKVCADAGRRPAVIAAGDSGAIAAAGMEGRIFYVHSGKVVSLFRPEAAVNFSNSRNGYFNPGGDGLWPAPEGTCFGYEYSTGSWRVPMGLVNAQYEFTVQKSDYLAMSAEVDLINSRQLGVPVRFHREVRVRRENGATILDQVETIEYLGARPLDAGEFLLAPWSLSQFRVTPDARAAFGTVPRPIRDFYDPSAAYLREADGRVELTPNAEHRLQVALPETANFVELTLPQEKICITRRSQPLESGLTAVDIADAPVTTGPQGAVRYSIYNDPSGFMELEAVGGCKAPLMPGDRLRGAWSTVIRDLD